MEIIRLEEKIAAGYRLGYDEALELMRTTSPGELYELAHRLRTRYQGKRIDTCSIMNARSGRCSEDCKWCAQSKFHKTDIDVYPLVGETEAVQEAAHNASKGVGRFSLVTSGRTLTDAETDRVCAIYRRIGREVPIRLCASLGLLTREQLVKLRETTIAIWRPPLPIFRNCAARIRPKRRYGRLSGRKRRDLKFVPGVLSGWGKAPSSASSLR